MRCRSLSDCSYASETSPSSTSRSSSPEPLAALANCLASSLCTSVTRRLGDRGDGHRLVVQLADSGRAMRRNFPVGVEAELRDLRPELGAQRLRVRRRYADPSADDGRCSSPGWRADRRRDPVRPPSTACRAACAAPAASRSKFPRISCAVQPSRHIAGERHRARLVVDRENGADDVVVRPLRIEDAQREQQTGTGQTPRLFLAEIAFVKIERRLAVELEQHVAVRSGDLAPRPELVPAAGAAVTDTDRLAVEPDRRNHVLARRQSAPTKRLAEFGAVAGEIRR